MDGGGKYPVHTAKPDSMSRASGVRNVCVAAKQCFISERNPLRSFHRWHL
jgi:hypothetical protein